MRRRQWHPTPVLLPGKSHGWRSLVGCSPWGCWGLDTTEQLHFHFSLSCIGEGNGNPLQCSCLENPRVGGAWWLPSMGSHRVGHDWSDLAAAAAAFCKRLLCVNTICHHYSWYYYFTVLGCLVLICTSFFMYSRNLIPCHSFAFANSLPVFSLFFYFGNVLKMYSF